MQMRLHCLRQWKEEESFNLIYTKTTEFVEVSSNPVVFYCINKGTILFVKKYKKSGLKSVDKATG